MSYVSLGADPFQLFDQKLAELRAGKTEEAAGARPPAPASSIKWWCWDSPGFKDCHGGPAFRAAQADCAAEGKADQGACIVPRADYYSQACPCAAEPPAGTLFAGMSNQNLFLAGGAVLVAAVVLFGKKAKPS